MSLVQTRLDHLLAQCRPGSTKNLLSVLESSVNKGVTQIAHSRLAICVCLAVICDEGLYRNAGFDRFQKYLDSGRVKIPKSTASEYVKIGRTYIRYHEELAEVDFDESEGLKKLLLLDQALSGAEKHEVFGNLKELSYREFRNRFLPVGGPRMVSQNGDVVVRADFGQDSIFMEIDDEHELKILELNQEIASLCGQQIYRSLQKEIVKTISDFFG